MLIRFQGPEKLCFDDLVTLATIDPPPAELQARLERMLEEPFISNEATLQESKLDWFFVKPGATEGQFAPFLGRTLPQINTALSPNVSRIIARSHWTAVDNAQVAGFSIVGRIS